MRTGIGYDIHPLTEGRPLVLGGVTVPFEKGLAGHSDGDALTHAIIDALLGAAALGDIGTHFPAEDERFEGADSIELLRHAAKLVSDAGYRVENVDSTVIAESPKLAPHIEAMRDAIAGALAIDRSAVSVKATTSDGLGATGRGEGIAALAMVLLDST
jgi:2-C-methyl-D-erythritol 2,4-cyclodiphosphate synthase